MSMSKLACLCITENNGIKLVHVSWIISFINPPCQSIELPTYGIAEWNYANLWNIFCQRCIILWLITYN